MEQIQENGRELLIRPATEPGDMGWILLRHGEVFIPEFNWDLPKLEGYTARILSEFSPLRHSEGYGGWIAEMDGKRIGCVLCVRENETTGRLRLLLVTPEGRGFGVGTTLVQHVLEFARARGYAKLILFTTSVQKDGHKIYEKLGFRKIGITKGIRDFGPVLDGYDYELEL